MPAGIGKPQAADVHVGSQDEELCVDSQLQTAHHFVWVPVTPHIQIAFSVAVKIKCFCQLIDGMLFMIVLVSAAIIDEPDIEGPGVRIIISGVLVFIPNVDAIYVPAVFFPVVFDIFVCADGWPGALAVAGNGYHLIVGIDDHRMHAAEKGVSGFE